MGGCCCCSSRRAGSYREPTYYYRPQNLEEHEPLSTTHGTCAVSAGMLVDTILDTSIPDTYRAPPAPLPYDAYLACSQILPGNYETSANKADETQPRDLQPVGDAIVRDRFEGSDTCEDLKESECKKKTDHEDDSMTAQKDQLSKLEKPIASEMEEDVCPICLEGYDLENPHIITKCEHHFHLSCILEWMERSDTCPICDQSLCAFEEAGKITVL